MMTRFYILICISLLLFSCGSNTDKHSTQNPSESYSADNSHNDNDESSNNDNDNEGSLEKYPDGTYCAEVQYRNPHTGTHSTYTLTVEVESNEVTQINFPNGGWMDQDHFNGADLDDEGNASFNSDKGYDYEIQITGSEGDCTTDNVPRAQQCRGTTEDGDQCENMTDNSNGLCWQHQDQE
jgi:hypothetical protein